MQIPVQNFSALVQNAATYAQGACSALLNLTVGSALRSVIEATASVALWIQYQILLFLTMTRLATSYGSDVDTFVADFGLVRLPGNAATGSVTLTSFSPSSQSAVVPPGTPVKLADGSQTFTVTTDTTNLAWNVAAGAYIRPAGAASITVPIAAAAVGAAGNVAAGTIVLLGQSVSGIDTATNAAPLTNGANAETDAALKARFSLFIQNLPRATLSAVENAIAGVQQGITFQVNENADTQGNPQAGHFTVIVDDGSGHPSQAFLNTVGAAVDATRALTSTFSVIGPNVTAVVVGGMLTVAAGQSNANALAAAEAAVTAYFASLPIGAGSSAAKIIAAVFNSASSISDLTLAVNGGDGQIAGAPGVALRVSSFTLTATGGV